MAPFVKMLIPAGLGILFHYMTGLEWGYTAVCCALSWPAAWYFAREGTPRKAGWLYPWLSVLFFFASASGLTSPDTTGLPDGKYIHAEVVLSDEPTPNGRWQQTTATVTAYSFSGESCEWQDAGFGVQLYLDTVHNAAAGERLLVKGYFNVFGDGEGSYGQLMIRRGVPGRMYVTDGSLLARSGCRSGWLSWLHNHAVKKMSRLPGDTDKLSIVTAMVSGDKRQIPRSVRGDYRDGAGAHLLAVSGLHVGIVFVLVNLFLYLVPFLRRGYVIKNFLAIGAVWMFAASAGLSPSVVRSALMFSFVQFALARGTRRNALNIIAASAFIMLGLNPNFAGDPSFVLSYAAVLAIILYFGPVYGLVRTRYKLLNGLIGIYIVGLVASVAVAPFVSYWFGSVPVAGIIVNPVVIFTAHIIVGTGVLWLLWPFGFGGGVFGWVAEQAVTVQNGVMEWCASLDWATVEVHLPLWGAVGAYCIMIFLSVPLEKYSRKRRSRLFKANLA